MEVYNKFSQKVNSVLSFGRKRKREPEDEDPSSDALEGLINVSLELAKNSSQETPQRIFKDVTAKDGWELLSCVHEGDDEVSITPHIVLGFYISNEGRVQVVSTISALDSDPRSGIGPCSNEIWILKNPNGIKYWVDGEHQGVVNEGDILGALKKKVKNRD